MAELASLEDPKARAVNERHGDDYGVNLGELRAVAKKLKTQQPLAILIGRPQEYSAEELDAMLRDAVVPKVHGWLTNYIVKKNPHVEELRTAWFADPDPIVASAGWALTSEHMTQSPEGLDLDELLNLVETQMKDAPDRRQWAMNESLAAIGIKHPQLRARAIDIGERLEVLKDYPTPPNCTSPFAPIWISEIVRRQASA